MPKVTGDDIPAPRDQSLTLREQWLAAMADVTVAKDRLVNALLVLQGVQVDYMAWWDAQPVMFRNSARGKRLEKIIDLILVVDVRALTEASKVAPP